MVASTSSDDSPPPPSDLVLPSYPEMIMRAIASLAEENGSSQAAIARRIEAAHGAGGDLPPSHPALVAAHLSRMAAAGELVAVSGGKYTLPRSPPSFPAAAAMPLPPKRGRGRPPKSRSPLPPADAVVAAKGAPAATAVAAPRRRGRPPKPRDPHAPPKIVRPRGRPRKNPLAPGTSPDGMPRPRGPSTKVPPQFAEVGFV